MPAVRAVGPALPNIPWEDRPGGCADPVWRSARNPIIGRHATPTANSVFNSAAVPFEGGFAGVFRVDDRRREMRLHAGFSDDGVAWRIEPDPIPWQVPEGVEAPAYGYDPRVCRLEDTFLVTWCNGWHGPTIGLGRTDDFKTFQMVENALLPCNRNGVLFPRRIGGRYMMLSRPSDNGHTPFGEVFVSQSEDLVHWGRHRWVMRPEQPWESTKIGPGPVPIETSEGWLMIYHGVLTSCNGYVYHWGACLLDLDEPWRVRARCAPYLMSPQAPYELAGDVPNVVFPCAALVDPPTGRLAVYYGAADTVTGLAFGTIDGVVSYVLENQVWDR
jgi:beta-1,4-mannooligosaccharide/beta-1,4-mannosyl-N-acetylglucosamine phosphorylase